MKITYIHKFGDEQKSAGEIKPLVCKIDDIDDKIAKIIFDDPNFSSSKTFGAKGLGSPEEYEKLELLEDDVCRTFEYYNKGIHFMFNGGENDRPVFCVFAHFGTLHRKM